MYTEDGNTESTYTPNREIDAADVAFEQWLDEVCNRMEETERGGPKGPSLHLHPKLGFTINRLIFRWHTGLDLNKFTFMSPKMAAQEIRRMIELAPTFKKMRKRFHEPDPNDAFKDLLKLFKMPIYVVLFYSALTVVAVQQGRIPEPHIYAASNNRDTKFPGKCNPTIPGQKCGKEKKAKKVKPSDLICADVEPVDPPPACATDSACLVSQPFYTCTAWIQKTPPAR